MVYFKYTFLCTCWLSREIWRMDFTWASIKICLDFQTNVPVRGETLGSFLENTKTPKNFF